jgi:hypothetical protein
MNITDYIIFNPKDLLTHQNLYEYLDMDPLERARLVARGLSRFLMVSNGKIYKYDYETILYDEVKEPVEKYLLTMIRKYVTESFRKKFKYTVDKDEFKLVNFQEYVYDVQLILTENYAEFDDVESEVHYLDGYTDKDGMFYKRNSSVHYITKYVRACFHDLEIDDEENEEDEQEVEEVEEVEEEEEEEEDEDFAKILAKCKY